MRFVIVKFDGVVDKDDIAGVLVFQDGTDDELQAVVKAIEDDWLYAEDEDGNAVSMLVGLEDFVRRFDGVSYEGFDSIIYI